MQQYPGMGELNGKRNYVSAVADDGETGGVEIVR